MAPPMPGSVPVPNSSIRYDGVTIGSLHHILHVQEVGRVGTQVVLQTLFVTDVYHDVLEDTRLGTLAHRDAQSALQHILKQSYGLQTYRLTSGVRTRDDEDALLLCQRDVEWHHLLVFLLQEIAGGVGEWHGSSLRVDGLPLRVLWPCKISASFALACIRSMMARNR